MGMGSSSGRPGRHLYDPPSRSVQSAIPAFPPTYPRSPARAYARRLGNERRTYPMLIPFPLPEAPHG